MSMLFELALQNSLFNEGGFVLSKLEGDSGGLTFAGIAKNKHPDWEGWELIDSGDTTSEKLKQYVSTFYRKEFWDRLNCENLPVRISPEIFDFGINAGTSVAAKCLQRALGVHEDGDIGPKTVAAARSADQNKLMAYFFCERLVFYTKCNTWDRFGKGWTLRVVKQIRKGFQ